MLQLAESAEKHKQELEARIRITEVDEKRLAKLRVYVPLKKKSEQNKLQGEDRFTLNDLERDLCKTFLRGALVVVTTLSQAASSELLGCKFARVRHDCFYSENLLLAQQAVSSMLHCPMPLHTALYVLALTPFPP